MTSSVAGFRNILDHFFSRRKFASGGTGLVTDTTVPNGTKSVVAFLVCWFWGVRQSSLHRIVHHAKSLFNDLGMFVPGQYFMRTTQVSAPAAATGVRQAHGRPIG